MLRVFLLLLAVVLPATGQSFLAVNLSQNQVVGGATVGGTVAISQPAPPGGTVVTLWSGDDVRVPSEVIIPAGQTYTGFSVATNPTSQPLYVRIQASTASARQTTFLQVMPAGQAAATSQPASTGLQMYKEYPDVGPVYGASPYGWGYGYWYPGPEPWARPMHFDSDGYPIIRATGGRR